MLPTFVIGLREGLEAALIVGIIAAFLRRGFSYTDGIDAQTGLLDAGLFFIAFQQDPREQFVPIQRKLGSHDALNEYIRHTSCALFAVPPGLHAAGDWWGKSILT